MTIKICCKKNSCIFFLLLTLFDLNVFDLLASKANRGPAETNGSITTAAAATTSQVLVKTAVCVHNPQWFVSFLPLSNFCARGFVNMLLFLSGTKTSCNSNINFYYIWWITSWVSEVFLINGCDLWLNTYGCANIYSPAKRLNQIHLKPLTVDTFCFRTFAPAQSNSPKSLLEIQEEQARQLELEKQKKQSQQVKVTFNCTIQVTRKQIDLISKKK